MTTRLTPELVDIGKSMFPENLNDDSYSLARLKIHFVPRDEYEEDHMALQTWFKDEFYTLYDRLIKELVVIREDLVLIKEQLNTHEKKFEVIEHRLDSIEVRLDTIEVRLDTIEARLDTVEVRLTTIEQK